MSGLIQEDMKLFRYGINTFSSEELAADFSEVIGGRIQKVLGYNSFVTGANVIAVF
jgi:hypothetical protein